MQAPCEEAAAAVESAGVGGEEKEVMVKDPGRGRRSVWLAPLGLGSPFQVTYRLWSGRVPPALRRVWDPDPPSPENLDTVYFIYKERAGSGWRARVISFSKERKPAGTVSREEYLLLLALFPPCGWLELPQVPACGLLRHEATSRTDF